MKTALNRALDKSDHPWLVVLMPKVTTASICMIVPEGSVGGGRTWRTPTGQLITVTTPERPVPATPFELFLWGWGHKLSTQEMDRNKEWRAASA